MELGYRNDEALAIERGRNSMSGERMLRCQNDIQQTLHQRGERRGIVQFVGCEHNSEIFLAQYAEDSAKGFAGGLHTHT